MNHLMHRRSLALLLVMVMLLTGLIGSGSLRANASGSYTVEAGSILENIPLYTHGGTYMNTYSMGAEGLYYAQGSTTEIDPLLNGEPIVDELGGGEMLVFTDVASADSMASYEADLEAAGYLFYAENDLGGNLFSTWVNDDYVVTLSYLPNLSRLHILAEPMRALPGLEEENIYENLEIENKAVFMTCGYIGNENGMCVIWQLCDGSFIILDSGYGFGYHPGSNKANKDPSYVDYYQNQAKEIYNTMEAMAKESGVNEIVIAAWIFSHPHWDHMGGIVPFAELYGSQVTLEKVILNHPNQESIQELWDKNQTINITYVEVMQDAFALFTGSDVALVEAHAGQKFFLRDAVINVLSTWELQTNTYSGYISVNEGNAASVIFTIDIGSERMLMTGDCGRSENNLMLKLYSSDFLNSDFLQVAHHGYNSFTKELNERVAADVILWTNDNLHSSALAGNFSVIPEILFYHNEQLTVIPLPFTGVEDVEYQAPAFPLK